MKSCYLNRRLSGLQVPFTVNRERQVLETPKLEFCFELASTEPFSLLYV